MRSPSKADRLFQYQHQVGYAVLPIRCAAADPHRAVFLDRPVDQRDLPAVEAPVEPIEHETKVVDDRIAALEATAHWRVERHFVDGVLGEKRLDVGPVVTDEGLLEGGGVLGEAGDMGHGVGSLSGADAHGAGL